MAMKVLKALRGRPVLLVPRVIQEKMDMTAPMDRPDFKACLAQRVRSATLVRQAQQVCKGRLVRQGAMERLARRGRKVRRVILVRRAAPGFPVRQARVV
jgi:hypothetical protein